MNKVTIPNCDEQRDRDIDILMYIKIETVRISIRKTYNQYYLSYHEVSESEYDAGIYSDNLEYLVRKMYHYARNLQ